MSVLAKAKAKAAKGNLKGAFVNSETGAIDLASIMVGIIVIGLIGGVIAATVFAVIPWAQDNAAKQQLDSVAAAQSAYVGLSTEGTAASYGTAAQLGSATGQGLFNSAAAGVEIAQVPGVANAHYAAVKVSASGKVFSIHDRRTNPDTYPTLTSAKNLTATAAFGSGSGAVWASSN